MQQPTSNQFQCNFEFKANCQSDPIRSKQSDPGFVNGQPVFKTARSICFTFFEMNLYLQEIIIGLLWSLSNCHSGIDKNCDFSPFYKLGVSYAIQQTFSSDLNWPLKKITRLHMKKNSRGLEMRLRIDPLQEPIKWSLHLPYKPLESTLSRVDL